MYALEIRTILGLLLAATLPILIAFFLPRKIAFYQKPGIRGFGLGVYTALVVLLLKEGVEHSSISHGLLWFIFGLLVSFFIGVFLKEFHHHHTEEERLHRHTRASMWRIFVSDFFHNIVDGIAIISGFGASSLAGITSLVGITTHQMIQQSGQQILLMESGLPRKRALWYSFLISLSMILGLLFRSAGMFENKFVLISSGIIAWKIFKDIKHTNWQWKTALGFMLGVLVLSIALILVPHE